MEVLCQRCAGIDVHKKTVVAAVRLAEGGKVTTEVKTFATTTTGLLGLADWLYENDCTHVAMEATGVYWKPIWHVLSDGELELVLANAAHVKNVPGRKTDVSDAAWLADLLAHGLIRASFVPDGPTQELRALLRTRKQLVREKTRHTQRIHKTLEDANIKLDAVLSNVLGKSGRAMLDAMIAGESDPAQLAALAQPGVKCPPEKLCEALRGRLTRHHCFLLQLHLGQVDGLDAAIGAIDQEVEGRPSTSWASPSSAAAFRFFVTEHWKRTRRRRSQIDGMTWQRITRLANDWLPKPRILHPWPQARFAVTHPRWEPYAGKPHVRFCAGGA